MTYVLCGGKLSVGSGIYPKTLIAFFVTLTIKLFAAV